MSSDYGAKSRQQMMARYEMDRRKRKYLRKFWHFWEYRGVILWGSVCVFAIFEIGFLMTHR